MNEVRRFVPRNLRDDGMIEAHEVAHYTHLNLSQYVLASDYDALADRLAASEKEVEKYKVLFKTACTDNIEEYRLQCKPKCDSYGHEEDCPSAHPGLVYDELRKDLATAQATIAKQAAELEAIRDTVGDTEFALRQQVARLRECVEYYAQTAIGARAVAAMRETKEPQPQPQPQPQPGKETYDANTL